MAIDRRFAAIAVIAACGGFSLLFLPWGTGPVEPFAEEDRAFVAHAFAHYQAGRHEEAMAVLDAGLAHAPDNAQAWYYRGLLLEILGRPREALEDMRRAVELDPRNFAAYRELDLLFAAVGQAGASLPWWDRYLKLRPGHAEAWMRRAAARHALGDRSGTLADLERACELGGMEACNRHQQMTLFQ